MPQSFRIRILFAVLCIYLVLNKNFDFFNINFIAHAVYAVN